jgi:hypothetical protein
MFERQMISLIYDVSSISSSLDRIEEGPLSSLSGISFHIEEEGELLRKCIYRIANGVWEEFEKRNPKKAKKGI